MLESLEMADMLLVTTPDLADIYRPYTKNVRVCPNSVNINLWKKLPLIPHRGVRMGWFGGDTHYEDWLLIAPVLRSFMEHNPDVTLVLMGAKFDGTLKGIPPERIEHHHWTDISAYPYKAAIVDLDFAVIPLVDNDFNNGKSPIKWLEMGSLEVPSVTSYVKPYIAMDDLVKNNGLFVEGNSLKGWYDAMTTMAREPRLRKEMGLAARETVEKYYDANKTWKTWQKAFEECVAMKPQDHKVPLAIA
jgi:glycosyltransferase involved in cell wall biosynthesis